MDRNEVVDILTLIAARDRRTVGQADVAAWLEDIGDLLFEDARTAVARHFRESTDWLMPANVRRIVKKIRAERLEGFQYVPVEGDEDPDVYLAAVRAQRAAVADGQREAAPAIEAGEPREVRALISGAFHRG